MFTPEIKNSDISRITYDNGTYSFTIGEQKYRTNENGEGLWHYQTSDMNMMDYTPVWEWKQILGTSQFTAGANPRAAVAEFALRNDLAYEDFLREEGLKPSKTNALKFLRLN